MPLSWGIAVRPAIAAGVIALTSGPAMADPDYVGWAFGNKPQAKTAYKPDPAYSYNSSGGAIVITPQSTGIYQVSFGGLYRFSGMNLQAFAYHTSGYCNVGFAAQAADGSEVMTVYCFDAAGNLANTEFVAFYQNRAPGTLPDSDPGYGYVLADQPSLATTYNALVYYSYNSTGATNTITRTGTGIYQVAFPGLTAKGGNVQVTALGAYYGLPVRCKAGAWSASSAGTVVTVECFDVNGAPVDRYVSVAYTLDTGFAHASPATVDGLYAWTNKPTDKLVYTPAMPWNFSAGFAALLKAQKTATGKYALSLPTFNHVSLLEIVTGYDGPSHPSGSGYCNLDSHVPIVVRCYQQGGTPANSIFDIAIQGDQF